VAQLDLGAAEETAARPVDNIWYGTSSWTDRTLLDSGEFYPPSATKPAERLRFYASQFPLVEVDSSYYALPSERNSELWAERTPPGFIFNVKAFGLLTAHGTLPRGLPERIRRDLPPDTGDRQRIYAKDLPEPAMDLVWDMFNSALEPLAAVGKLGAVLFQFPKWFTATRGNAAYLREVAERSRWPVAVEFRGGFWMAEERQERTLGLLEELGFTYVVVDEPQGFGSSVPPVVETTNPELAMVRFHGHNAETWEKQGLTAAERFRYLYSEEELRNWVPPLKELAGKAKTVHALMNNCYADYGVRNAAMLGRLLAEG
jgi:uncharacterized protein YecE (DUF72 family)